MRGEERAEQASGGFERGTSSMAGERTERDCDFEICSHPMRDSGIAHSKLFSSRLCGCYQGFDCFKLRLDLALSICLIRGRAIFESLVFALARLISNFSRASGFLLRGLLVLRGWLESVSSDFAPRAPRRLGSPRSELSRFAQSI